MKGSGELVVFGLGLAGSGRDWEWRWSLEVSDGLREFPQAGSDLLKSLSYFPRRALCHIIACQMFSVS